MANDPRKYARLEIERRWLLEAVPADATGEKLIVDRYITDTRLRLRAVTDRADPDRPDLKLGQKVRLDNDDPRVVLHTTMYLDPSEFVALSRLPAATLTKRRTFVGLPRGGRMAVDVFEGPLAGLILAEIELGDEALEPPTGLGPEVTGDDRFTGGRLATMDRPTLRAALADLLGPECAARLVG